MKTSAIKNQENTGASLTTWLNRVAIGLAVIGALDSLYLGWLKITGTTAQCGGIGDCESVNNSIYAEINGFPIAFLGLGAYLLILGILLVEGRLRSGADWPVMSLFGLSLVGTLYSVYLTYIEVAVLRAICPYCVVSAIAVTLLLVVSIIRLRQHLA
ncbi:MAG: vitamin K epoxide reductase family protein [Chloroflexi bacterium]|nr:vitamin K epoxide reductase family protein [Chloroflexota bacterium]